MTTLKILAAAAGLTALAAAPAAAQYYPYGPSYGARAYGNAYGAMNSQAAAQRCAAAVQGRLDQRGYSALGGFVRMRGPSSARVLGVTQVDPKRSYVRVRGVAASNAYAGYGPYGAGAYGALGYGYAQPRADLKFKCDVDYRGYVRDVDIERR